MPNHKIMIVEDEEIVAADIQASVEQMGYSVCAKALSGLEAIEKANLTRPDLILMDIMLKGSMDGIEAATQIKKLYKIPVIYLTAFGEDGILQRAKVAEPYGYITKPFRDRDLQIAIEISIYKNQAEAEKAVLEAQNRQLQKAESLGRMASAIVHHFNNMLQAIMGNMQMAIRQLPQDSGSVKNMTAAMQAAREAEAITNQTMTYLGDTSDKPEPLDLCDLCRLGLPLLQAAIPKNVILETDLPSRGPTITANVNQMQQVLTNLVTNAWEAVGDGQGIIYLRVKTVSAADIPSIHSPTDWQPQDSLYGCLEVTDTGSGIAESDIENLFDPIFSSKFIGRGLGLSVVLGIAKAHHGAVAVQSELGQGSTFSVFLPASAENVVV
jgi:signal transduction histidine kinase